MKQKHQKRPRRGRPRGWKDYPLVKVRRVGQEERRDQLVFWCPFCKRDHLHGVKPGAPRGDGDGHRVAHCQVKDSPFRSSGYVLWEKE